MDVDAAATQITPYGERGLQTSHRQGLDDHGRFRLTPIWVGVLAMLAFLTLLLSFDYVVRHAVQTAELRRQNAAAQRSATWRCHALRDRQNRDDCLGAIPGAGPTSASNGIATGGARF